MFILKKTFSFYHIDVAVSNPQSIMTLGTKCSINLGLFRRILISAAAALLTEMQCHMTY